MSINEGDSLPDGTLLRMGPEGPQPVQVSDLTAGRKVVFFAVPGAFTPTCHSAHMPSFIRTKDSFDAKGVDAVYCVAVNDPFVLQAWSAATGADKAGIEVLSDGSGDWSAALGQQIANPGHWVDGRSKRYALFAEDGVVKVFHPETGQGCEISGGEAMLARV